MYQVSTIFSYMSTSFFTQVREIQKEKNKTMTGKRHNRCKLPPFLLKRAKDGNKEYLLNVYSVINDSVCSFSFLFLLFSFLLFGIPNSVQQSGFLRGLRNRFPNSFKHMLIRLLQGYWADRKSQRPFTSGQLSGFCFVC